MPINTYNEFYNRYFNSEEFRNDFERALQILRNTKRIFFIGNGGSMAICSHMMEDYAKIGGFRTFAFSDAALITCFANDYGYENAMAEWLKLYLEEGDLLISISSSGNSANIINATDIAKKIKAKVITLTGFSPDNKLRGKGDVNFYLPIKNYGVVECFHQVIVHALLDKIVEERK